MEYTNIKNITPQSRRHWTAKVRVIEKSFPRKPQTNTKTYQRLILVDEEGTRVQATIFGNDVEFFTNTLKLLHHYQISNATVTPVESRYQIVPHAYQWTINRRTPLSELQVNPENEITIPLSLVPFSDFSKYVNVQAQVDILAVVITSLPQKKVQTEHNQSIVQEFVVLNEELKPTILTIWDQFVLNEATYILAHLAKWPIILGMRLKVGSYNGISLSTKSSTTFVMEPTISEALILRSWTTQNHKVIEEIVNKKQYIFTSTISTSSSASTTEITKIEDIPATPQADETFKVCASAAIVNIQQRFFYMSCNKCNKSIDAKYELSFTCNNCNKAATAIPRCCIEIQLQDASGHINGTIFGEKAEDLFSITAVKLLQNITEFGTIDNEYLDTASNDKHHIFLLKASHHQHRGEEIVKFIVVSVYDATDTDET